jgi:DNA-binding Xre family transcriptional regulator
MNQKEGITKLKRLMKLNGLTQNDLAHLINNQNPDLTISNNTISTISSGKVDDYKISTLYRLCKALGVTPNDILDYENNI